MIITADRSVNINSTARLVSIVQPAHSVMCVSFWYHIFGNSIGILFTTELKAHQFNVFY